MWPQWRKEGEPEALSRYVLPEVVAALLPELPGPVTGNERGRLEAVYAAWAAAGVRYAHEPPTDDPAFQAIRPPDHVLRAPGHATCLDAAVTFAGACLAAGLHPLIAIAGRDGDADLHAVVAVWLEGSWEGEPADGYPLAAGSAAAGGLADHGVRSQVDGVGAFLALDPSDPGADLASAVAAGRALVRGEDGWRPPMVVDVGRGYRAGQCYQPPGRPLRELAPPYEDPDDLADAESLKLLRAEYRVVPFQGRDELEVLRDWCTAPGAGRRLRLAVVTGVGGAGKTRLVAELAHRLAGDGWHTGFVPAPRLRMAGEAPVDEMGPLADWLAVTTSPLLLAVDYAESRWAEVARLVASLGDRPGSPTCIVLTARELGGWWDQLEGALTSSHVDPAILAVAVRARPERAERVFRRAVEELRRRRGVAGPAQRMPAMPESATTLDVVLVAWLVALFDDAGEARAQADLYDEVLKHERRYWRRVFQTLSVDQLPDDLFDQAAVVLTMLGARPERAAVLLRAVDQLDDIPVWRVHLAAALGTALATREGTLALTPDPVADHLAIGVLGKEPGLLTGAVAAGDEPERATALVRLTRAAPRGPAVAIAAATGAVGAVAGLWPAALAVAEASAGPCVDALVALAEAEPTPLPLAELAEGVALGHATLRPLAAACADRLVADHRRAHPDPAGGSEADQAELARRLSTAAVRQGEMGRREEALGAIEEAVGTYRRLAEASPAAFLANLAGSLNNQANLLSAVGRREEALGAIEEAVGTYRRLAEASPAAFLADLAMALNNQANLLSAVGRREEAMGAWSAAIDGWSGPPGAVAELVAWRCRWRFDHDDPAGARDDVAVVAAITPAGDADLAFVAQARRRARAVAGQLPPALAAGLPGWAITPIADATVDLLNGWAAVAGSRAEAAFLDDHAGELAGPGLAEALAAMADLYPDGPVLSRARMVVDAVAAGQFNELRAAIAAANEATAQARDWLATPTWAASRAHLEMHGKALRDQVVVGVLQSWAEQGEAVAAQHLAILALTGHVVVADLFDAVVDAGDAVDLVNDLLAGGQPELVGLALTACPALAQVPFYGPAALAVALAMAGQAGDAADAVGQAAAEADPTQRSAYAGRLRRLAVARPDVAERLSALVAALDPPAE